MCAQLLRRLRTPLVVADELRQQKNRSNRSRHPEFTLITWADAMQAALFDTAVALAVVFGIWLIVRRHVSPRWCYRLFLLVPLKTLVPLVLPWLPAARYRRRGGPAKPAQKPVVGCSVWKYRTLIQRPRNRCWTSLPCTKRSTL